ncbi:lysophospholipid acyltransferase family protein [Paenibacillus hamazuiensis]|uniref:lysophospholipid acyltransferase family protein n=1 Tax=Paenibacillus hamazuiensis TaxID=2936508 RepID=UPI00200D7E74|nr:lysophospholipid acyltransferase family protein [Paenibacillus hamazuiensis]
MYEWISKLTGNSPAVRRLAAVCGWLPRPVTLALLHFAALLLYMLAGSRIIGRIAANMKDLLPQRREAGIRRYTRQYLANVVISLYEILIDSQRLSETGAGRFIVRGEQYLRDVLREGRGAIVFTPHTGNFFYYYWYLTKSYNCLTVATGGSPELRPLYEKFQAMGCPGLDYDSVPPLELLRRLKKHLEAGGIVFLLGDFWRPAFPLSEMFGRTTRSPEGAALLSIEQKAAVIPFYGRRVHGFTHELVFESPLPLYERFTRKQRGEATRLLNRFMEKVIRLHPEQWFYWFNAEERWERETAGWNDDASPAQTG